MPVRFMYDEAKYEVKESAPELAKFRPIKMPDGSFVTVSRWLPIKGQPPQAIDIKKIPTPHDASKAAVAVCIEEKRERKVIGKPPFQLYELRKLANKNDILTTEVEVSLDDLLDYTRHAFLQFLDALIVRETVMRPLINVEKVTVVGCTPGDEKSDGKIKLSITANLEGFFD